MGIRKDSGSPRPPEDDFREINGFPDKIRQIDLAEIIRLRYRLQLVKEELNSMEAQIAAQLNLGLPLESGRLTLEWWGGKRFEIKPVKNEKEG